MKQVIWAERARADVRHAFDYYKLIDVRLGLDIVGRIETKAEWLGEFPYTGTPFIGRIRKSRVDGLPYLLFYRVEGDHVEITRLRHASENWRG